MRYFCTIYTTTRTLTTTQGTGDTDPSGDPVASTMVSGASKREAAARAYVECVGRERARLLREQAGTSRRLARQQTNTKAIAASLRKTNRSGGDCYLMDNYLEGWYIHVEPVLDLSGRSPRRLRLPHSLLLHLSRTPSPN